MNNDRRSVPQMLADGKINADEAERRMREHLAMLRETYVRLWTPDGARRPAGSGVGD